MDNPYITIAEAIAADIIADALASIVSMGRFSFFCAAMHDACCAFICDIMLLRLLCCSCVIAVPVDYYVPGGYVQFTLLQNYYPPDPFPVSSKSTLIISTTNAKSCPASYGNASQSTSYEITISIKGTVVDASGRGVSGIDVSGDISGGGSWQVNVSGGTFSGNATPSLESGSATTDCNGNFAFTIKVSITVDYSHGAFASSPYNTSYYNMDLQSLTLRVTSGALPSATTIISFNEYVAAELCNYIYGAIS